MRRHAGLMSLDDARELICAECPIDWNTGAVGKVPTTVSYAVLTSGEGKYSPPDGGDDYGVYRGTHMDAVKNIVGELEGTELNFVTSSGRSAIHMAFRLLPARSHIIVAAGNIYPGTEVLLERMAKENGHSFTIVRNPTYENLEMAKRKNTRMVFSELIANPTLEVCDPQQLCKFAKDHKLLCVVDNTFTPGVAQPLAYGADIVIHSLTKYLSASGDTVGGSLSLHPSRKDLYQELVDIFHTGGVLLDAAPAGRIVAGSTRLLENYALHSANALELAQFLREQTGVKSVCYPSLPDHPQHDLVNQYFGGMAGGVLNIVLKGGRESAQRFMNDVSPIPFASSLGMPWTVCYNFREMSEKFIKMDSKELGKRGMPEGFIRIAVGRGNMNAVKTIMGNALTL